MEVRNDFLNQLGFFSLQVGMHTTTQLPPEAYEENSLIPELNMPVGQFINAIDPSVRLGNCLESANYGEAKSVNDLLRLSDNDLLEIRNFGQTCIRELQAKLLDYFRTNKIRLNPNDYPPGSLGRIIADELQRKH